MLGSACEGWCEEGSRMYVRQKEDRRPVLAPLMVVDRSGNLYLPCISTEGGALEKIVWLEIESEN